MVTLVIALAASAVQFDSEEIKALEAVQTRVCIEFGGKMDADARHRLEAFGCVGPAQGVRRGFCQWKPTPEAKTWKEFVVKARELGAEVFHVSAFSVTGPDVVPPSKGLRPCNCEFCRSGKPCKGAQDLVWSDGRNPAGLRLNGKLERDSYSIGTNLDLNNAHGHGDSRLHDGYVTEGILILGTRDPVDEPKVIEALQSEPTGKTAVARLKCTVILSTKLTAAEAKKAFEAWGLPDVIDAKKKGNELTVDLYFGIATPGAVLAALRPEDKKSTLKAVQGPGWPTK